MSRRFSTGTRIQVLRRMADFAIRDQEALIEAWTPQFGQLADVAAKEIEEARRNIADFQRIRKEPK